MVTNFLYLLRFAYQCFKIFYKNLGIFKKSVIFNLLCSNYFFQVEGRFLTKRSKTMASRFGR